MLKKFLKSFPVFENLRRGLNNQYERDDFVIGELRKLPGRSKILDAGCGSQRYRQYCGHLVYKAQDFGKYTKDEKPGFVSADQAAESAYSYGTLDYVGDIWQIAEKDESFDAILCTEVLEHIPFPIETIREFRRLLRPGGTLILTAPSNCLRHMDPYFFYTGFSDRWFEKMLADNAFSIERLDAVGDYYRWLAVEAARTAAANTLFAKILLAPAFLYFYNKARTDVSTDTLCMGYHVLARRK